MSLTFTENGIMIDGKPLTEHPNLRFYGDTEHDGTALRFGNLKPNEDKPMEYRVKTDLIDGFYENEDISKKTYRDLISKGCPESWFEPVEQVQEGQYRIWKGEQGVFRVMKVKGNEVYWQYIRSSNNKHCACKYFLNSNSRELSTDEIKEALTEEAKRRGLTKKDISIKSWTYGGREVNYTLCSGNHYEYDQERDCLTVDGAPVYEKGQWAEVLDQTPDIEINGTKVESITRDEIKLGCGDTIDGEEFRGLFNLVKRYDLKVSRNGEHINEQIQQIAAAKPLNDCKTYT